jgi:hypothetical protein
MRGWQRTLSALHFACETISTMQFRLRHHHTISMRMIHAVCLVRKARSRFNLRVNDLRKVSQLGLASAQDLRGGGDVTAMHLSVRYANISIPDGCIFITLYGCGGQCIIICTGFSHGPHNWHGYSNAYNLIG